MRYSSLIPALRHAMACLYKRHGASLHIKLYLTSAKTAVYTPDFWIDDLALWVEIKPNTKIAREEEAVLKCTQLAYETGDLVYLDYGGFAWPISDDAKHSFALGCDWIYSVLFFCVTDHVEGDWIYSSENHYWAICPECGKIGIATTGSSHYLLRYDIFSCECDTDLCWLDRNSEIVREAYDKALIYWI